MSRTFLLLLVVLCGCEAPNPSFTIDFSFPPDMAAPLPPVDAGIHDLAYTPYTVDLTQPVRDIAWPPDMSGLSSGVPTIHCTADNLPDGMSTQSIYTPDGATDLVGLCDGWVALADHDNNQLGFLNAVTHHVGSPIALDGSPGRLALDAEHDILYATLSPATKIARIDLRSSEVHYISGFDAAMLAIGNNGQVLGVNRPMIGPPQLTVFDGTNETILATVDLSMSTDGTLIAFDRGRNLIVTAASGATSADPWYSSMNRFAFDPQKLAVTFQETIPDVGINGEDLLVAPDGLHVIFPCGMGNDGDYSLTDFHTDDFSKSNGSWPIGAYPASAAFSPDGKYLAATNISQLELWDASSYTKIAQADGCYYTGSPHYRVAYSRGGKVSFLLTSSCYEINSKNVGLLTYLIGP